MNIKAFSDLISAENAYLLANGWVSVTHGKWRVPQRFGHYADDIYSQHKAVQFQRQADSEQLSSDISNDLLKPK